MNHCRKTLALVLMLSLVLSLFSGCGSQQPAAPATETNAAAETAAVEIQPTQENTTPPAAVTNYEIGDKMEDFTVTTFDGKTMSLYEVLEEKEMVLINFWATWCGPCGMEFPAMEEAYEAYQDKIEIFALSTEPTDTNEVLSDYVAEKGMTFPVARDDAGISSRFQFSGIPTSVIVDRFGMICAMETGAQTDSKTFTDLFDLFTGEDYTESLQLMSFHSKKPDAAPSSAQELADALNAEGGNLVFENGTGPFDWPMVVSREDGRSVVKASNAGSPASISTLKTTVQAQAGDALVVSFKMNAESPADKMTLKINGEPVKYFASTRDWCSYAHTFGITGEYDVEVSYTKDMLSFDEDACLWIDSIALVSGEEAAAALEKNPQYLVSPQSDVQFLDEAVKYAYVCMEENPAMRDIFYITYSDPISLRVTMDETVDPEIAYYQDQYGNSYNLLPFAKEDGYYVEHSFRDPMDYELLQFCLGSQEILIVAFPSEEAVEAYCSKLTAYYDTSFIWGFAEESSQQPTAADVNYIVTYTDQNGDPVPGVMCQVCDDTLCQVYVSDANGVCSFTLPAYAYEIHTLKVPEGYEGDTTTVTQAPAQGGNLEFTLTKK